MSNKNVFNLTVAAICLSCCSIAWSQSAAKPSASGYQWVKVTGNAAYAPRDGAGALVYKDKMWLLGGWNTLDLSSQVRTLASEACSQRFRLR